MRPLQAAWVLPHTRSNRQCSNSDFVVASLIVTSSLHYCCRSFPCIALFFVFAFSLHVCGHTFSVGGEVLQASPYMPAFSHVRCLLFLFAFASSRYRIVSSSFCSIHSRRERIHERDLSHSVQPETLNLTIEKDFDSKY